MEHTLEIIGTVVGILYLWLEYRASIYLWIAGIIMPAVYIFVYYDAGLYADFGINIYYLGAAIMVRNPLQSVTLQMLIIRQLMATGSMRSLCTVMQSFN